MSYKACKERLVRIKEVIVLMYRGKPSRQKKLVKFYSKYAIIIEIQNKLQSYRGTMNLPDSTTDPFDLKKNSVS